MKILFIDTVHPFLKQELEKQNYICDAAYDKNKAEIQEIIHNYQGVIIRSRFIIDKEFIDYASELKFIAREYETRIGGWLRVESVQTSFRDTIDSSDGGLLRNVQNALCEFIL